MTQALSDPNREIRNTAVVLLAQSDVSLTEAEAKAVLPTFIGALQDGDSRVTIAACQLSEKIEPKPTQMVLALIDACNHKDRRVRAAAMTVFQNMNAAAIPALIEGLQSGDTEICLAATRILGSQGTKAKAAAADLQVTLTDQNVEVRMASMRSLSQIIGSDAIPALTECLSDPNSMARAEAIQVLSTFGPKAGTVLSAAMKDNYWDVRQGAAVALGRMQVSNSIVTSALTEAVRDENADVRVAAIGAISNQELSTTTIVSTLNPTTCFVNAKSNFLSMMGMGQGCSMKEGVLEVL